MVKLQISFCSILMICGVRCNVICLRMLLAHYWFIVLCVLREKEFEFNIDFERIHHWLGIGYCPVLVKTAPEPKLPNQNSLN